MKNFAAVSVILSNYVSIIHVTKKNHTIVFRHIINSDSADFIIKDRKNKSDFDLGKFLVSMISITQIAIIMSKSKNYTFYRQSIPCHQTLACFVNKHFEGSCELLRFDADKLCTQNQFSVQ